MRNCNSKKFKDLNNQTRNQTRKIELEKLNKKNSTR